MPPIGLSPASQTASTSSSTLWAQPSREWVIPAKPKPGRKPKKETPSCSTLPKDEAVGESFGRRVQNRAAQRAFRERKQTQLAELQARLQSYEQGEMDRHVALQSIAKKMKEENDELRKENQNLRETIFRLEREREESLDKDKKRTRDDTFTNSPTISATDSSTRKRVRYDGGKQEIPQSTLSFGPFLSSSSSLASSPDDVPSGSLSSAVHEGHSRYSGFPTPISNTLTFATPSKPTGVVDTEDPVDSFDCILCSPDTPCVCRELAMHQATNETLSGSNGLQQLPLQGDKLDQQSVVSLDQSIHLSAPPPPHMSILDNLPAFQAPVPIRRRTGAPRANQVFPVTSFASSSSSTPKCSGDPDNCMACSGDDFGKAFCQAIDHTVNSSSPCVDCPRRTSQADAILVGGCCGDISKCGSCGIAPIISSTNFARGPETIPTDAAWRQLKSHPNVAFADLTLLAEVVARRSKCTGSRVVVSPALGPTTPEREAGPSHLGSITAGEDQSVLLTDPHEHFYQKQRQRESPPRLVPQHILIECGRRRMREVNTDGVREALRLLDQKFAHTR
ncbi:hypothetical protein PAXRUDRAFT_601366 [Paxillus rubicundulus Ve08.2h10]|uniref:BZIP domain-containing protein n=1 Tax=Paxillus rubicundulus Ve08.2h10 TaxID=930991 RepID=A0A0D0DVQ6_9AGAM|nr:hypothetical protein PAXRUDRAFT_601366 [Paxillus rubicundulus Ve08.2h10]